MTWTIAASLAALTGALVFVEQRKHPLTLRLSFRGDVNRETAFLAQYGQSIATPIAGWLAAIAHDGDWRIFAIVCLPVLMTSIISMTLKRTLGRIRPNRENAGRFTGWSWRHSSKRESFPSSHSACAMALSVTLSHVWPQAAVVFWLLAGVTALLRYVNDAHFPSDIVAGTLLGLAIAQPGVQWLDRALLHR